MRNPPYATAVDKGLKVPRETAEESLVTPVVKGRRPHRTSYLNTLAAVGAAVLTVFCTTVAIAVLVLHIDIRPVLTGSMVPTYGPGAILVTRPVATQDLRKGMIILFVPPGQHVEFAHRIASVTGGPGGPIITTKGDHNTDPDPWHARITSSTVPQVVATVPWVGRLMVGLRGPVQLVLIVVGGLVVAVSGTRSILRRNRAPGPAAA